MKLQNVLAATAVCALAAFSTVSRADLIETFQLTSDHCSGGDGCIPGTDDTTSAGTITVTDLGGGVLTFQVTLNAGYQFIGAGFQADIGFNLDTNPDPLIDTSPTITYTSLSSGWAPTGGSSIQTAGALHMDGTGDFEYGVDCTTGCPGGGASNPYPSQTVNFTITGAGLTLSSLQANALGQFFAIDVFGNGRTGAIDASSGTICTVNCGDITVPEPGSLALIGIGMIALVGFGIRKGAMS